MAESASSIIISGGTHVPWSPSFHYLALHWLEVLLKRGFNAQLTLDLAGYYPQGNGRITATIRPTRGITPLGLTMRGPLRRVYGISSISNWVPSSMVPLDKTSKQKLKEEGTTAIIFPTFKCT